MEQTLGKRIVSGRKSLGLTQDALAEKLGVTAQAVSKWENDQSCPDITMLPKLAEIFGTTTDALLGIESQVPVQEAQIVPKETQEDGFQFRNGNWEFKYDASRRGGIFFAVFVLLVGALYLVSSICMWSVGLWDIVWPSALLVWGIHAQKPKFSFFGLGCIIFGGFFLVNNFVPVQLQLDSGVVVAIIILLIGGGLLMDALGKPRKPVFQFNYNAPNGTEGPQNDFSIDGETFEYNGSFGDHDQFVSMARLRKGAINTNFGDFSVDLSGVTEVSEDCRIEASSSFGNLTVLVPKKFQARCTSSASFAGVETEGSPAPDPVGLIQIHADASFGQITVKYI